MRPLFIPYNVPITTTFAVPSYKILSGLLINVGFSGFPQNTVSYLVVFETLCALPLSLFLPASLIINALNAHRKLKKVSLFLHSMIKRV